MGEFIRYVGPDQFSGVRQMEVGDQTVGAAKRALDPSINVNPGFLRNTSAAVGASLYSSQAWAGA